ncbi:DUF3096 domain-containing protein [Desulfopila sp. IMCC35006]|nr:DUF3096 domain-containing protein [Desulfopila sp. IMCC35006]
MPSLYIMPRSQSYIVAIYLIRVKAGAFFL